MRGEASDDGRVYQARRDQLIEQRDYTLNVFLDRGADAETYRGEADRIVTVLLHAVGSLEERCEALERKAVRARSEGRAEAYAEIQAELQESGLKLRAVQGKLKEAQQDREVAERLLTEARRAAEEYRREIEELRRRQEVPEPRQEPEPEPGPSLGDYDRFIDAADAELATLRASLERLGDEMSLRDDGSGGRVVTGEVVDEGAAAGSGPLLPLPARGDRSDAEDLFPGEDGCGWMPASSAADEGANPQPEAGTPDPGATISGTPVSGTPDAGTLVSGAPGSGTPVSGAPGSGTLVSGAPGSGTPVSGIPVSGPPGASEWPDSGSSVSGAPDSPGSSTPGSPDSDAAVSSVSGAAVASAPVSGPEGAAPKGARSTSGREKVGTDVSFWVATPAFLLSNAVLLLAGVSIREMYAGPHGPAVAWGVVYILGSIVLGFLVGLALKSLILITGGCAGDYLFERLGVYALFSPLPLVYALCLPASLGPWVSAAARLTVQWVGPV